MNKGHFCIWKTLWIIHLLKFLKTAVWKYLCVHADLITLLNMFANHHTQSISMLCILCDASKKNTCIYVKSLLTGHPFWEKKLRYMKGTPYIQKPNIGSEVSDIWAWRVTRVRSSVRAFLRNTSPPPVGKGRQCRTTLKNFTTGVSKL